MTNRNYGKMPQREVFYHIANLRRHENRADAALVTAILLAGFAVGFTLLSIAAVIF